MNLLAEIGPGITSLEFVRTQLRMDRPVTVKDLLAKYREPIVLDEPLVTPDGVALGGHHTITLERNGHLRHEGHMRATGFPSFRYGVRTASWVAQGHRLSAPRAARFTARTSSAIEKSPWDKTGESPGVMLYWASLKGPTTTTEVNFESDFFGTVGEVAAFVATIAGGSFVAGAVGVCFVLGIHGADAIGLDEALGTAGLAGVLVAAGVPDGLRPAPSFAAIVAGVAAGVAVELSLKHRKLTERPEEVAFANRVFAGTLPS